MVVPGHWQTAQNPNHDSIIQASSWTKWQLQKHTIQGPNWQLQKKSELSLVLLF